MHRGHRLLNRAVCRHEKHRDLALPLLERAQKLEPAHRTHLHIADHKADLTGAVTVHAVKRIGAVVRAHRRVARNGQRVA